MFTPPISDLKSSRFSRVSDTRNALPTSCFVAEHYAAAPAVDVGASTLYRANTVAAGPAQDVVEVGGDFTNIGAGTEASRFFVALRRAGGVLTRKLSFTTSELQLAFGASALTSNLGIVSAYSDATIALWYIRGTTTNAQTGYVGQNDQADEYKSVVFGSTFVGTILGVATARAAMFYANSATSPLAVGTIGAQAFTLGTTNLGRWQISSAGHFLAFLDATYNIGASGASRPANVFVSTTVQIGVGVFTGAFPIEISVSGNEARIRTTSASNGGISGLVADNNSSESTQFFIYGSAVAGTLLGVAAAGTSYLRSTSSTNFVIGSAVATAATISTNNVARWQTSSAGHFLAFLDATYNIGAAGGANRPNNVYVATLVEVGGGGGTVHAANVFRTTAGGLTVKGNRTAASTGADVELSATTNRTAGNLVEIQSNNGAALKWAADFRGINGGVKGADVVAAGTITLTGQSQDITGNTGIDFITTTDVPVGSLIILKFEGTPTVNHNTAAPPANTAPFWLQGAAPFVATADDILLLWYDGTYFRAVSQMVA